MLSEEQIRIFRRTGHLTVLDVFGAEPIEAALDDLAIWSEEFLRSLSPEQHDWYLDEDSSNDIRLRKLDNPVFHRGIFRAMAADSRLIDMVQQLIGHDVSVFFSQVFMKPPDGGGPKPIHQDNFYFGPDDLDATLTVWIALDAATTQNGCLYYADSHQREIVPHIAPAAQPYNLQIPDEVAAIYRMVPAPVPRGGVSFHHGNTPHQSAANHSDRPRRAAAFHYLRNDARLVNPALPYDDSVRVRVP